MVNQTGPCGNCPGCQRVWLPWYSIGNSFGHSNHCSCFSKKLSEHLISILRLPYACLSCGVAHLSWWYVYKAWRADGTGQRTACGLLPHLQACPSHCRCLLSAQMDQHAAAHVSRSRQLYAFHGISLCSTAHILSGCMGLIVHHHQAHATTSGSCTCVF